MPVLRILDYVEPLGPFEGSAAQWAVHSYLVGEAQDLMWIDDHLDDIESDLSVFHRVDDVDDMLAPRFVKLAKRLAHYEGAIRHWAQHDQQPAPDSPAPRQAELSDIARGSSDVMAIDPVWGQLGTFTKAPAL